MVNLNRIRCWCACDNNGLFALIRGWYDSELMVVFFRVGFLGLGKKHSVLIPEGLVASQFKRAPLWYINVRDKVCVPAGVVLQLPNEKVPIFDKGTGRTILELPIVSIQKMVSKLDLIGEVKFFRAIAGSTMSIIETLILMFAGFGILRFVEYLFTGMGR